MWKMRYYPYYYRPPIEWTAIRTWSELGKKKVKYTQAMADELSRDTVLWGLSYEGGKNTQ